MQSLQVVCVACMLDHQQEKCWQSMPATLFASHTTRSGVTDSPQWLVGCSQICAPCSVSYLTQAICLTAVCKPFLAWLTDSIWHRLFVQSYSTACCTSAAKAVSHAD